MKQQRRPSFTLVAPGENIFTAGLTGGGSNPSAIAYMTGTSIAAPHVAGAMAVLKGAFPDADPRRAGGRHPGRCSRSGCGGRGRSPGAGYLDAVEAYYLLAGGMPPDLDGDGEKVADTLDLCLGTPAGETGDLDGVSIASSMPTEITACNDTADAVCQRRSVTRWTSMVARPASSGSR